MAKVSSIQWEDAYAAIEPHIDAEGVHHWQFDSAFPLDVRFFLMARSHNVRLNRHDYFELLYLQSGSIVYDIHGRDFRMSDGDLAVISGTQYHRIKEFGRPSVKTAILYFMPDLIQGGEGNADAAEYLMPFLVQDEGFPHVVPKGTGIPAQIFDLMRRTRMSLPGDSTRSRLTLKTYLKMMLVLLVNYYASYRGTEAVFDRRQRDLERLRPLFEYIDENYATPMTIGDAASQVFMSKSHFTRFFRQVTGYSFISYLNRFRVSRAQLLMSNTGLSIAEISQNVGFCDQSYFGLIFKQLVHMTPREFKENRQKMTPLFRKN